MKTSGMADSAIKQALMSDLNTGGPLFGSFRNKLKNTVRNGVELSSNGSSNSTFTKAGVQEFQWVSVGDGKVCPDCEERHGETGTMEYFETIGLPASGFSVCTTNCRCQLLPQTYKGENLDKPLVKEKKINVNAPSMAGKHKTVKDAQSWASKNGLDVEYKNASARVANTVNKAYVRNVQSGKPLFNKVKFEERSFRAIAERTGEEEITLYGWKNKKDLASIERGMASSKGYMANNIDEVLDHESGHILERKSPRQINESFPYSKEFGIKKWDGHYEDIMDYGGVKGSAFENWTKQQVQELKDYKDNFFYGSQTAIDFEKVIGSSYANVRIQEAYAEVYTAYINGRYLPDSLKSAMERAIRGEL